MQLEQLIDAVKASLSSIPAAAARSFAIWYNDSDNMQYWPRIPRNLTIFSLDFYHPVGTEMPSLLHFGRASSADPSHTHTRTHAHTHTRTRARTRTHTDTHTTCKFSSSSSSSAHWFCIRCR